MRQLRFPSALPLLLALVAASSACRTYAPGIEERMDATVKLETGKEYQFGYLIDGKVWENDWAADKYVPNNFTFEDNSVVAV